ncbi:YybH family protein [Flavihumibacter profundi]|jgi:uncharacterized protein (TIGR02246 family)|uniref:YybH family protein n=1 Tax=Flavihumibacter profundi TaxID=2716883 RepID=UPI001CC689E6|nr:DUF4440 domain-containing protein [Flavihumibacter profundi]MBZ5859562.1 DUF4440 domain-containing protein [Flavihumibacter profundi]
MTKFSLFTVTCFFSFLLFGCNNAEEPKETIEIDAKPVFDLTMAKKEIDSANQNFMDLVGKGDSIGVANCYTADAKFMGPNGPAASGRENIQPVIAGLIKAGPVKLDLAATDVWGNESMLAEEGVMSIATMDGKQLDKGKYIVLWKKEDGKWKLFRDIFNSDLPVPKGK